MLSFLNPVYFSFKTSVEGVARREEVDDIGLYRQNDGQRPCDLAGGRAAV